jgi:hypothetical protein
MMRGLAGHLARGGVIAAAGALAVGAFALAPAAAKPAPAVAKPATAGPLPGRVSTHPAAGTPALAPSGSTEQVRQLVQCGTTMFAVGRFTKISRNGTTYTRDNVFSFSAVAPYRITSWTPSTNGEVNSIAVARGCTHAYIGGSFTRVDGQPARNIAEINTRSNTMVSQWPHSANSMVNTLLLVPKKHLLVGGDFTTINGSAASRYYASLNPATGQNDGYLKLHLRGHYVYPGVHFNTTEVYNQQLSPDGRQVLAEGVFTSVQGQPRQQIFMLDLDGSHGDVSGWNSSEFNQQCNDGHPLYVKTATWSPDGSTVYVADTGKIPWNWNKKYPLTSLCDAAAAFPATQTGGLTHKWVNYTGCYTLLSVAAGPHAVYIGGHERYGDDANGCKFAGPGSFKAPGLGGLEPSNGALMLNSSHTAGRYSRARGLGADDMLLTGTGLWIASDNFDGSDTCGGVAGHSGICFLPY